MGGEKLILLVATPGREGSPPRGRGKGCPEGHGPPSKGITPAWAGKSHAVHSPSHGAGDHPRVGGEKWMTPKGEISYIGSPPRGRGKGLQRRKNTLLPGITPAWAGKRTNKIPTTKGALDHPRVGGEKDVLPHGLTLTVGSPPRGRGKAAGELQRTRPAGITPAWAGKRFQCPASRAGQGDHPRVGGEKPRDARNIWRLRGSPPRGRGKVCTCCCASPLARITPAWAGKSQSRPPAGGRARDHPRVGGEKLPLRFFVGFA